MKRLVVILFLVSLLSMLYGCGGSGSTTPPPSGNVTIALSPATATINAGLTVQLTATVQNATNMAVTWQATAGTIGADGVYHAPAVVPDPATVTITAISVADATKSATATITITAPVAVNLSGAPAAIGAGQTHTFSATVLNHSNQSVTWSVIGSPTTGTITSDGVYTAPRTVPPGQEIVVKATSQADPTKTSTATVSIIFSQTMFSGPHVFSMFGSDMTGVFWFNGQFTADDSGDIVSGKATFRKQGNGPTQINDNVVLGGTYTVDAQGRGTISLTSTPPTINNQAAPVQFGLVVLSDKQARITTQDEYFNGQGDVFSQDATALSTTALAGTWVFRWGAALGRLTLDGTGHVTGVVEDTYATPSDGTTYTGTYSVGADGRAVLNIPGDLSAAGPLRVYIVDASHFYVIATDANYGAAGFATRQQDAPFTNASLKGNFVFSLNGRLINPISRQQTSVGLITADGAGNFVGQIDTAYEMPPSADPVQFFAGTYTVDAGGRAVLVPVEGPTLYAEVFSKQHIAFLAASADFEGTGQAWLQQGGPFSATSLKGNYGWTYTGSGISFLGVLRADGVDKMSGTASILYSGMMNTDLAATATYSVEPSGRGTVTVSGAGASNPFVFYMVSPGMVRTAGPTDTVPASGFGMMRF